MERKRERFRRNEKGTQEQTNAYTLRYQPSKVLVFEKQRSTYMVDTHKHRYKRHMRRTAGLLTIGFSHVKTERTQHYT